jgi:hypothetical protein
MTTCTVANIDTSQSNIKDRSTNGRILHCFLERHSTIQPDSEVG